MNGDPCPDYFWIGCGFLLAVIGVLILGMTYA
ncbi:hypothetical protein EVB51_056 [Rhizobium phage RHph_Y17]|nr:hypothetical protein EVB51_056 [Rhizobium phage RHph_Y17]QIG68992.1 hypothetical protein EVB73_056 [Rhizobium phage RHph_Y3_43]QIG69541.1 hypothetical protein EVB80_058 [Rhizobium phage RHph_I36]QIG75415.1 hypothetical protein EVC17_058 [Rhizobium phage RHph_Y1_1]QIG75965.1 hypothetical protein EVC21_058 [Rhizobium phage RHph_Y2_17_2]QXV74927.1 hypothetical protein [Rhizobium phage RHEph26]